MSTVSIVTGVSDTDLVSAMFTVLDSHNCEILDSMDQSGPDVWTSGNSILG